MGQEQVVRMTLLTPLTPTLILKKMSLTLVCLDEMRKVSVEMKISRVSLISSWQMSSLSVDWGHQTENPPTPSESQLKCDFYIRNLGPTVVTLSIKDVKWNKSRGGGGWQCISHQMNFCLNVQRQLHVRIPHETQREREELQRWFPVSVGASNNDKARDSPDWWADMPPTEFINLWRYWQLI